MNNPPCRLNCILPFHKQEQQNFFLFKNFKQISNKKKQKNKIQKFKNSKTFISLNILNTFLEALLFLDFQQFLVSLHVYMYLLMLAVYFLLFLFAKKEKERKKERKKKSTENTATKKKKMMKMVLGFFGEDR
jgi:ABC-type protease/lipase transport system fused ATPase/permease subunit